MVFIFGSICGGKTLHYDETWTMLLHLVDLTELLSPYKINHTWYTKSIENNVTPSDSKDETPSKMQPPPKKRALHTTQMIIPYQVIPLHPIDNCW